MKFSSKDFFSKCHQFRSFVLIWSHLLKKPLMENCIFCAVNISKQTQIYPLNYVIYISKVFTILCLLWLCGGIGNTTGSFQNKSLSSSFKWVPAYNLFLAKLKGEGRPSFLHVGVMLTIVKRFIILFLLCLWE